MTTSTTSTSTTSSPQLESSRTRSLLGQLSAVPGGFFFKLHGSPFQPRVVDIIGCLYGQFIAIEVKRPNKKPTPRQLKSLRDIESAGGITAVLWSSEELKIFLKKVLDRIPALTYSGNSQARNADEALAKRSISLMAKATKTASKPKGKSKPVEEEEDDDLEDLDDLDLEDIDDDDETDDEDEDLDDEDDEDDDEDEEEPPARGKRKSSKADNDAKAAKAKSARKASPVKTKAAAKPADKSKKTAPANKGNAGNLTTRRVPEGMVGASQMAEELGIDAKTLRVQFRKLDIPKNADGVYAWKPNSRDYQAAVKKVRAALAQ